MLQRLLVSRSLTSFRTYSIKKQLFLFVLISVCSFHQTSAARRHRRVVRYRRDVTNEIIRLDAPIAENVNNDVNLFDLDRQVPGASHVVTDTSGHHKEIFDTTGGKLRLVKGLSETQRKLFDFETYPVFSVFVNSTKNDDVTDVTVLEIQIPLQDVNDEPPVFTNEPSPFLATVSSSAPAGTVIYTLTATDPDTNPRLTMEINTDLVASEFQNSFRLQVEGDGNSIKGKIVVADNAAFPENAEFSVQVTVQDDAGVGTIQQKTQKTVRIKVGTRVPQIYKSSYSGYFYETNERNREFVQSQDNTPLKVEVVAFQGGSLKYELLDSNGDVSTMFIIQQSGYITNQQEIDYEVNGQEKFDLKIRVTETANNVERTSEATLQLNIKDENDNDPTFTRTQFTTTIPENEVVGRSVLSVTASDRDSSANGEIDFSLPENDYFSITTRKRTNSFGNDEYIGDIIIKGALDYDAAPGPVYEYKVIATDKGVSPRTSSAKFQITVTNVNDNAPDIDNSMSPISLLETSGEGFIVALLHATDKDGDSATFEISSTSSAEAQAMFSVESSGSVKTRLANIPKDVDSYTLVIKATDDASCCVDAVRKTSTKEFIINIVDVNQNKPEFTKCSDYETTARVKEESDPGTQVVQVSARDDDRGDNGKVLYIIMTPDPVKDDAPFQIDQETGIITVKNRFERKEGYIQVTVKGRNPSNVPLMEGWCTFRVTIEDVNNHAPEFSQRIFQVTVPVTASPNYVIRTMEAKDEDVGVNANITYSIKDDTNIGQRFSINLFTGILSVAKRLSTDTSQYNLVIIANDNGIYPGNKSGTTTVIIKINTEGSQQPSWVGIAGNTVSYSVEETSVTGTVITTLECQSNVDEPEVEFFVFDSDQPISGTSKFFGLRYISNKKMELTLINRLDYMTSRKHTVSIVCRNKAAITEQTFLSGVINVIDQNNKIPEFTGLDPVSGSYEASIPENARAGTVVITVSADDKDETYPYNNVTFSLTGSEASYFNIDNIGNNKAIIRTTEALAEILDRETTPNYDVSVTAEDGAPAAPPSLNNPNRHNQAQKRSVLVKVTDINDNSPSFSLALYKFDVGESRAIGEVVGKVLADDPDQLDKVQGLKYFFNPPEPQFSTSDSGDIRVARRLDYENENERKYTLTLMARDGANHENSTTVEINVLDDNDNTPIFDRTEYVVEDMFYEEDKSISISNEMELITVMATDLDQRKENKMRYSLSGYLTSGPDQRFRIDPISGTIYLIGPLDREDPQNNNPTFSFNAIAADEEVSPRFGYTTVKVTPKDINDNAPVFDPSYVAGSVDEHSTKGTSVMTVVAKDPDALANGEVRYKIPIPQSSDYASYFRIDDEKSGEIRTNTDPSKLDRETTMEMSFVVEAFDGGKPSLSSNHTITVTLTDINDQTPFFEQPLYIATMSENQKKGEILRIQAIDRDSNPDYKELYYRFTNPNPSNHFEVEKADNIAIIKVVTEVDYEKPEQREFELTLQVRDKDESHTNSTQIKIFVTDYNDNAPKFEKSLITVDMKEEQEPGDLNVTFIATDKDSGINAEFEYSIVRNSDPLHEFFIGPTSGKVSTRKKLDREKMGTHRNVIIMAKDKGEYPQSSTATLSVTLRDLNDNAPTFKKDYRPQVEENVQYTDHTVVTVEAEDPDDVNLNHAGPFTFSLPKDCTVPACDHFSLTYDQTGDNNQGSAVIKTSSKFDREAQKQYLLPIVITDKGGNSGTSTLTVVVADKNDNKHKAGHQDIFVYKYEDNFGAMEIGRVYAEDPDDWDLPDKTFLFESPEIINKFFTIDENTGMITMAKDVPVTTGRDPYNFKVSVSDKVFKNTEICTVAVTVAPLSDEAVRKSGSIRLADLTADDFLYTPKTKGAKSKYDTFRSQIAQILGYPASGENVEITSMSEGEDYLDVMYTAHGSPYHNPSQVESAVMLNQYNLQTNIGVNIKQNPINLCMEEVYDDGCYTFVNVTGQPVLINANGTSFVGAEVVRTAESGCAGTMFPDPEVCRGDYCYNGGTCVQDNWGKLTCSCLDGYDGPRCQQLRHNFNGKDIGFYRSLSVCADGRTSFEFITQQKTGILLYSGPIADDSEVKDFLVVQLVNGYLKVRLHLGAGQLDLGQIGTSQLSDGQWHTVTIERQSQDIQVTIDHCMAAQASANGTVIDWSVCRKTGIVPGGDVLLNVASFLQLGGRYHREITPAYPPALSKDYFNGCIKSLRHNSILYDLHYDKIPQWDSGKNGCPKEETICGTDIGSPVCGQRSTCISQWSPQAKVVDCTCLPGYYGDKCQQTAPTYELKSKSYMKWELPVPTVDLSLRHNVIDLMFRTRQMTGNLFTMTTVGQASILLQLEDGKLTLSYDFGHGPKKIKLDNAQANTGQWHKVKLSRYGNEFYLTMDGGEGRNFRVQPLLEDVKVTFKALPYISAGAQLPSTPGNDVVTDAIKNDLIDTCLRDIRFNDKWLPMVMSENNIEDKGATLLTSSILQKGCIRPDCVPDPCNQGLCVPLWGSHICRCSKDILEVNGICPAVCLPNPCFGDATCSEVNNKPVCKCPPGFSGPLCNMLAIKDEDSAMAAGAIVGIVLAIIVLLLIIVLLVIYFVFCRQRPDEEKMITKIDPDDDFTRENIMFYDEEGAGEEDHHGYNLNLLTRPDTEVPMQAFNEPKLSRVDNQRQSAAPSMDRPDVGSFIDKRIADAEHPDDDPFGDSTHAFDYEGANSDAGSLSSLNSSSTDASQDYDYLSHWGDKFARLADMYGAGHNLDID